MFDLLVAGLAVFFAWELLLTLLPASLPPASHPFLVVAIAYGATRLPDEVTYIGALAGAVGVLHALVRHLGAEPQPLQLPRSRTAHRRIPQIP